MSVALPIDVRQSPADRVAFQTIETGYGELRAATIPFAVEQNLLTIAVAMPTREVHEALANFRKFVLVLFPLSLVLMAAVSVFYANRSLRPVAEMTRQASEMIQRLSPGTEGTVPAHPLQAGPAGPARPEDDELKVLAATFNELFRQLDSVVGQLRQFVSDAAHELKTPLSVLRGETELLLARPRTTGEYEQAVRVIDAELKTLSRIVEGLFTLSMADAGQLRFVPERVDLEDVLEETVALAAPLANQKGIRIEREFQEDVVIWGDPTLLRQLFFIFIDNAIKYSPADRVLQVKMTANQDVRVRFEDQGTGIAGEHLTRIFERFFRAPQQDPVETQSGGLGLAIAQAIVQAHHGSIEVESELGVGSVFTVRLPGK